MSFMVRRRNTEPLADYGFFGPDSITWKVWGTGTSFALGFMRAVSIEQLDPNLNAAVLKGGDVYGRTRTRYDRTLHYFALVALGDSAAAIRASTSWSRSMPRRWATTRSPVGATTPTTRTPSCGST